MTELDRGALVRHLRQLVELGERELFFDELTAAEAIALLRGHHVAGESVIATSSDATAGLAPGLSPRATAGSSVPAGAAGLAARLAAALSDAPAPQQTPVSPVRSASPVVAARQGEVRNRLEVLQQEANSCDRCTILAEQRTNVVFARGNPITEVMVVGEAPGQEEDRTGFPFVGPAGKLLDLLLVTAGFPRDAVYICNTLKCRPPNNRNPLPEELAACSGFLNGQIEAISPRVLLAVGKFAAQSLLNSQESIGRLRGQVHTHRGTPLIVTYHPAYLLRSPQTSRLAWQDFQLLRQVLDEQA